MAIPGYDRNQMTTADHNHVVRMLFDGRLAAPETIPFPGGEIWVYSRRSPTKETANEDSAGVLIVNRESVLSTLR